MMLFVGIAFWAEKATAQDFSQPERGPKIFKQCVSCHNLRKGQPHRVGPNLHGLFDRNIAALDDFSYSKALTELNDTKWTRDKLNKFVARPHKSIPQTDMKFVGLLNPHDRIDLLAWLEEATRDPALSPEIDTPAYITVGGDASRGKQLFRPCKACHTYSEKKGHKIGPNLFGIIGRKAGSAKGYSYSPTLAKRDVYWNAETLEVFFIEYKEFAQGTHTAFQSLKSPQDRADMIAWLKSLAPRRNE